MKWKSQLFLSNDETPYANVEKYTIDVNNNIKVNTYELQ